MVVFRTRMRPDADEAEMNALGARMYALAAEMPGFLSYKDYQSADGEAVALVEFASPETLAAWRNHPEHLEAQRLGRGKFFSEYRIQVCEQVRAYGFP